MGAASPLVEQQAAGLADRRAHVGAIRQRARGLFDGGATGIQVAAAISDSTDEFIVERLIRAVSALAGQSTSLVERHAALIAVGGSGRRELAPYSDADLLFLYENPAHAAFCECVAVVVRDLWDAGIALGHNVCTLGESINLARKEPQLATTFSETRLLWGDGNLYERWKRKIAKRVIRGRRHAFVQACIAAREDERAHFGSTVHQLEPDVKRSPGGLRDVHLIRWIGAAIYGSSDIDSLRLQGALSKKDARALLAAQEFLMRIRVDLHFAATRAQESLTRDEQLRIARARQIEPKLGQKPVERFMQQYFQHSTVIAELAQRFIALHRSRSLVSRLAHSILTHRAEGNYRVGRRYIGVLRRHRDGVVASLEQILRLYLAAARYGVDLEPELIERIKQAEPGLSGEISGECARLFVEILKIRGHLGATLRSLCNTRLLYLIVPHMAHVRGLLQFNQYHSYTVDEHTLRAIEAAEQFELDKGPVGKAYRTIRHKELVHLALLLHDLGKGFDDDHSEVGRMIAEGMAVRLGLPDHHRETLVFLVHKHLKMSHLAFRRDISDPEILLEFSRQVGSPETLRMLYVLTVADVTAVGPGVWTNWKAELLTELFDRTMLILSGKDLRLDEAEQFERVKSQVCREMVPAGSNPAGGELNDWIAAQLDALPPHYWSTTPPEQIAADLSLVGGLSPGDVLAAGAYDSDTRTVEYRVITSEQHVTGCFHKTAGVLTAKRLKILSAQISTSRDGIVIDSFRVVDGDFDGPVPQERIDEIADAIRSVLSGRTEVEELFQRHRRFGAERNSRPISGLPTRVVVDNDSSEHFTVLDVFAHDRPGLLYTITRTIHDLGLSVVLAKIATHVDQVVDVFYVTDTQGAKLNDGQQIRAIQSSLLTTTEEFERHGHAIFVS